ncbi:MAG: right-handed parallel beta-helix repeat-containing protein [Planctomycetes bacterium]|nr:right-handed parallel beta-helix repeat-containing protein [Planctomycetota bacterium]
MIETVLVLGAILTGTDLRAEEGISAPAAGPRGPVGPDVPLSEAENKQSAKCIRIAERTAAAVQAACERAVKEGLPVVFLPAGDYVFESTVSVQAGLTLLGDGSKTLIRTKTKETRLFRVEGDGVRFTRLKLQGSDITLSEDNNTYGIFANGKKNIRIDHCELLGFSHATDFSNEATAQIDHCFIHHNLREGLGYGVAIYSGAHVLVTDNEFSQNRHSLASNGALDWSSPQRVGKYVHKPGVRKTHWEFIHNRVGSNDKSRYELCAVDTHPGMDGTFVVEGNLFENLRHGIGIRDGSGLIRANHFRSPRTSTTFRPMVGISISYGTHNNIPVENAMPHDIQIEKNIFSDLEEKKYGHYEIGKAENITIDGKQVPATRAEGRGAPAPLPRLRELGEEGGSK